MVKVRISMVLLIGAFLIVSIVPSWSQDTKPKHAPNALPGVEPEMLTADYWASLLTDADEVIMTPAEIERFNEKNSKRKVVFRDYYGKQDPLERDFALTLIKGLVMNLLKPLDLPKTLYGDSLRVRLGSNIEWLYSRDFYDGRNAVYSDTMRREIVDGMDLSGIPDRIKRRFGIIVNHANVRLYPTHVPGYSDTEWELDMFQSTGICLGNPVAILHKSSDGDFYYVESPKSRGWIASQDIAVGTNQEIRKLTEDKNFLMASGHKVPVYGDPSCKYFARYFYFSATMPLIEHNSEGYVVKMPYRNQDGSLGIASGYVKPDADVHVGYIPYTKHNVYIQIFKLLNQPYGWADQNNKRSCAGTMNVLLRCFGIKTGRPPSFLLSSSDYQCYIDPDLSREEKLAKVAKLDPGITLAGTAGHIVLYLGKAHNGKQYIIHQCGWGYDENGQHFIVNRQTINSLEHDLYSIDRPAVFTTIKN